MLQKLPLRAIGSKAKADCNIQDTGMIYVFKINIETDNQANDLKVHLDKFLTGAKCNFDLDDCDFIFRVEHSKESAQSIICFIKSHGFKCEELPDSFSNIKISNVR